MCTALCGHPVAGEVLSPRLRLPGALSAAPVAPLTGRRRRSTVIVLCGSPSAGADRGGTGEATDYSGRTQLSFRIDCPAEWEAEGDRIFAAHADWMKHTHHRDGDRALLQYLVAKTPAEDGVVVFHLTEIYQSPAGVNDHVEQAQDWDAHDEFVAWLDKCRVARTFDAAVRHSLW